MRNKIQKSNMARFDYIARTLGVIGLLIISLTLILGGTMIVRLNSEQQTLTQNLVKAKQSEVHTIVIY